MLVCLYVVLSEIGGITAPVSSFGSDPTWIARVPNPWTGCFLTTWPLPFTGLMRAIEGDIVYAPDADEGWEGKGSKLREYESSRLL
jgi:hypothetical protein